MSLTQHRKAIIFRREYPQLKDLVERSREIVGDVGRFNGHDFIWRLKDGRTCEFGAVQHEEDKNKYKGRPHDFKGFDEVTEFSETQFRFLIAWLRTTVPGQRCRVVCTFNPPTHQEGMWVIRYWAPWLDDDHPDRAKPGELRWFAMIDGKEVEVPSGKPFKHEGELVEPQSRTFFPARLDDNPRLKATGYWRTLMSLPEPLRSQLAYGSFKAGMSRDPWQVIPREWVKAAMRRWVKPLGRAMTSLGVDVAQGGKDRLVLAPRRGATIDELDARPGAQFPEGKDVANLVYEAVEGDAHVNIDALAIGSNAAERCKDLGLYVQPIKFNARSEYTDRSGKYKMANLRAEAYWRMRDALDPEVGVNLALPPDEELEQELCEAKFEVHLAGIQIEDKDDIIARLGRSPDKADAACLSLLPWGDGGGAKAGGRRPEIRVR